MSASVDVLHVPAGQGLESAGKMSVVRLCENLIPYPADEIILNHRRCEVTRQTMRVGDIVIRTRAERKRELVAGKGPVTNTSSTRAALDTEQVLLGGELDVRPVPAKASGGIEDGPLFHRLIRLGVLEPVPVGLRTIIAALSPKRGLVLGQHQSVPVGEVTYPVDVGCLLAVDSVEVVITTDSAGDYVLGGGGLVCQT